MAKKITPEEFEAIVQAVGRYPDGVGIAQLLEHEKLGLTHRTLQRRLAALVENGRLITEGDARALRYKVPPAKDITLPSVTASAALGEVQAETYVPISPEGEEIKAHVRQPRQARRPVSYNPDFLENYRPNETAYLPEALRKQLHILGSSDGSDKPAGTFARDVLNRLLIDLSWASSALEGNTYSRLDTQRLIELGEQAEGKDAIEAQMILNHKAAIELLVNEADLVGFNTFTILNLHALLSEGLLADPHDCGRIRQRPVDIGGSVYVPLAMPQRLEELFRRILSMAEAIKDPFEQAFFAMVHLPYLQPFIDVNKRVSRLAANIPLIKHNLCPLSFLDVPGRAYIDGTLGVYELNRIELLRDVFVWAYERSCQHYLAVRQSLVAPDPFLVGYRMQIKEVVRSIILALHQANKDTVAAVIPHTVEPSDRERFTEEILKEFENLYEGNIFRFGLRPSEFETWQRATGNMPAFRRTDK